MCIVTSGWPAWLAGCSGDAGARADAADGGHDASLVASWNADAPLVDSPRSVEMPDGEASTFCGYPGAEDGGCGDPQTDTRNCGGCGHTCDGGMCSAGLCEPLPVGVIATGQRSPFGIATDGVDVYWLNAGARAGARAGYATGGQLLKCAVSGCDNAPTVLATFPGDLRGGEYASPLVLDATTAYFVDGSGVRACAKTGCGCAPTLLAADDSATSLVVGDGELYFTTDTTSADLRTCPLHGCTGEATPATSSAAAEGQLHGMVAAGDTFYWTTATSIYECPFAGCGASPARVWTQPPHIPFLVETYALVVDDMNLYWTDNVSNSLGSVAQCARSNCEATTVALATARTAPQGIVVHNGSVYWADASGIMKCSVGGCGGNATLVTAAPLNQILAADSSFVYFSQNVGAGDGGVVPQAGWAIARIAQ